MSRRPALQAPPRVVFPSNPFAFMHFRTLLHYDTHLTRLPSIASALFTKTTGGGVRDAVAASSLPYTLPSRLSDEDSRPERASRAEGSLPPLCLNQCLYHQTGMLPWLNSFVCHSYENCRGVPQFFPFWNHASPLPSCPASAAGACGDSSLVTRHFSNHRSLVTPQDLWQDRRNA